MLTGNGIQIEGKEMGPIEIDEIDFAQLSRERKNAVDTPEDPDVLVYLEMLE